MDLSVIIVNYNVKHFLEHCLHSVLKAIVNIDAQVFVVDNNSTDGSEAFFANGFPQVTFIYNDKNVGFAKANNIALAKATGKYILFLNPDTIVAEDSFAKSIAFFETNANCGALGVRMIDGAGNFLKESKRSFPSPITSMYKLIGFANFFPKHKVFAKYHLGNLSEYENHEVDVLAGAYMMVRKSILDHVGSFDEAFFMYGEDVDLSYRIQKAGYKNYYLADTTIIHFKGESTKRGSLNYIKMFYKAMSQFVNKHYGNKKASVFNSFIQIAIFIRGLFSVIKQFIQWIGLPLIDACIILFCIWRVKLFWFENIKPDVRYIREIVIASAIIYTGVYIIVGLLSGLYDKPYKQARTNRAALLSTLVLLSLYALVPEQFRYSRGITAISAAVVFVILSVWRWLLVRTRILDVDTFSIEEKQTVAISNSEDYKTIFNIYKNANIDNRLLGQIDTENNGGLATYKDFKAVNQTINVKNIIFSTNSSPIKNIINDISNFPNHRIKFYSNDCKSIIGSDGQRAIGESITQEGYYNIETASSKRAKRIFDVSISFVMILFFPFVLAFCKQTKKVYSNLLGIVLSKKTWIGYNYENDYPNIKSGVFTQISHIAQPVSLPLAQELDYRYAKTYHYLLDIKLFLKNIFR